MAVLLKKKYLATLGIVIAAVTAIQTTPAIIGYGRMIYDVTSGGVQSVNRYVTDLPFLARATGTGSATVKSNNQDGEAGTKYAAVCIPSPLLKGDLDAGSGTVVRLVYHNISNPTGASGDIGFVEDCESGSGAQLIDNTCTATGCTSYYTTGTAVWNGSKNGTNSGYYLKFAISSDPTTSFDARITGIVEDIIGE